ncbi:MAG TPA: flagellar type III secretion system protein FlhB, partial [Candidatus Omnitrophota bacterium]|nr:flagellar type III secretion system protein FlhB [Candidatus Omnitrophota bacterium]
MAEDSSSEDKTEEPSDKKLSHAREEGNVAQSMEARIFATMVAGLILIGILVPGMIQDLGQVMLPLVERPHSFEVDFNGLRMLLLTLGGKVLLIMAWPMIVVIIAALAVSLAQTQGLMWVPKKVMPDFSKISPLQGLQRLFGAQAVVEFLKSMAKVLIIGTVLGAAIAPHFGEMANLVNLEITDTMAYIHDQVYGLVLITLILVAALAVGDFLFQKWRFTEKMKMTRQEVKDENKQQEGDPQVKAKIRSLRVRRARQRMMAAVPGADVVITNPTHFAVALKYDMEAMSAPVLVAKGADHVAARIREVATDNEVPIVEN